MKRWVGLVTCMILGWALVLHAQTTHSITVTHNAYVQGPDIATGINVYRSAVSGGPYTKLTATPITLTASYVDTTCVGKCFYVLTAVDITGSESINSNEVSATMLQNPLAPQGVTAAAQ